MRASRPSRDPTARRFGENTAAALSLGCALAAVLWAHSRWAQSYSPFWSTPVGLSAGEWHAELTLPALIFLAFNPSGEARVSGDVHAYDA